MRISGKDYKEFHTTAWPEGYIWESSSDFIPDGQSEPVDIYSGKPGEPFTDELRDDAMFTVPDYWEIVEESTMLAPAGQRKTLDLRKVIQEWLKKREEKTVMISIPQKNLDTFHDLLAPILEVLGGSIKE